MSAKNLSTLPESLQVCLLHDASGRVVHIHRVATLPGAKKTSASEVEARCVHVAKQLGHKTEGLTTLHVREGELKLGTPYKVDVKAKKLIELPRPARNMPAAKQK
jgi:hypothetical protein